MDRLQKLAAGSIVVGIAVLALKYAAYLLTGSIALYSDALESIINVVTAVVALLAVRTSAECGMRSSWWTNSPTRSAKPMF